MCLVFMGSEEFWAGVIVLPGADGTQRRVHVPRSSVSVKDTGCVCLQCTRASTCSLEFRIWGSEGLGAQAGLCTPSSRPPSTVSVHLRALGF